MNEHLRGERVHLYICASEILLHLIHIETAEFLRFVLLLLLFFPSTMHTVHTRKQTHQVMEFQLIESIQYTNRKIIKIVFDCTTKCTFAKWNSLQKFIHAHTHRCRRTSANTHRFSLIKNRFYFILLSASNTISSDINLWGILCVRFAFQLV